MSVGIVLFVGWPFSEKPSCEEFLGVAFFLVACGLLFFTVMAASDSLSDEATFRLFEAVDGFRGISGSTFRVVIVLKSIAWES